ncbi:NAD(P)H-binding [Rhizoctonia solani]|uniref:NAD(P)H-binding n=1 Tax=Rhizoctonia solani TaxID=456999 RepID=A0A8H7LZD3_9AGAM|nr:NAD(P)H-binding [Rhizoctonia solani]
MALNLAIIGGHGKVINISSSLNVQNLSMYLTVALHLARLAASRGHKITSVIRDVSHGQDISHTGATPQVLSLEDAPASDFTTLFTNLKTDVVYFSAGAGGKGGEERTKAVDYNGALKIFDAIDGVNGKKPRLVLVSGLDVGNEDRFPEHYTEADKKAITASRKAIPAWYKWKYEAEKVLVKRNSFEWIILRPGTLNDNPGTGTADIGERILQKPYREDVAKALLQLATVPPKASGLAIDMGGGKESIGPAIDAFIEKGVSDWLGQA